MIIAHAEFDMDSNCVWARTSEGNIVIVDCDAFEKAYADGMYQRSELDWLIYNAPREFVQLALTGNVKSYLQNYSHRLIG